MRPHGMLSGTAWWTWHGQQDVVEDIKNLYKWKELDEEKLITKIRTGSKDVCFRSRWLKPLASLAKGVHLRARTRTRQRKGLLMVATGPEAAGTEKVGHQVGGKSQGVRTKWLSWKDSCKSRWEGQERSAKGAWREERTF